MQLSRRAPDNELFDRGCDLVEAASAIRRLAADPESTRAIPALLGCIETSLQELAAAASELEIAEQPILTSERSPSRRSQPGPPGPREPSRGAT